MYKSIGINVTISNNMVGVTICVSQVTGAGILQWPNNLCFLILIFNFYFYFKKNENKFNNFWGFFWVMTRQLLNECNVIRGQCAPTSWKLAQSCLFENLWETKMERTWEGDRDLSWWWCTVYFMSMEDKLNNWMGRIRWGICLRGVR